MEDAATCAICRAQDWQWVEFGAALQDGRKVTDKLVQEMIAEQVSKMAHERGPRSFSNGSFRLAADLLENLMTGVEFPEFLTRVAYNYLD
jgi:malate synthase